MGTVDGILKATAAAAAGNAADDSDFLYNNLPGSHRIGILHIPSGRIVEFKSYITSYSDNFTSEFEEENTFGLMDPLITFKNTKIEIKFGWDVVAGSVAEAKKNLEKVSLLYSMLYPSYLSAESATSIATGPVFRLKWANLIGNSDTGNRPSSISLAPASGLVGVIKGLNFEPELENGGFFRDEQQRLYPQVIKCTIDYTVLHTHPLGWQHGTDAKSAPDVYPYGSEKTAGIVETVMQTVPAPRQGAAAMAGGSAAAAAAAQSVLDPSGGTGS